MAELTNCALDSTLRAFNCDWNPAGAGQVVITLTVDVSPETPAGSSFGVGSAVGNTFDQFTDLDIVAATTSTTTSTTTTTTTTTTTPQVPAPTAAQGDGETALRSAAPLRFTG